MTISILRTTDAWWVHGPDGATRITTSATTTQELLADRDAIESARRNPAPVAVALTPRRSVGRGIFVKEV